MSYYSLPSFNNKNIKFSTNSSINNNFDISTTLQIYIDQCYKYLIEEQSFEIGIKYVLMTPYLNNNIENDMNIFVYNLIEINNISNLFNINSNILLVDYNNLIDDLLKTSNLFNNNITLYTNIIKKSNYSDIINTNNISDYKDFKMLLTIIKNNMIKDGNLVFKLEDTYSHISINILYLIVTIFKKVKIIKPNTGYTYLSERCIICKNYIENLDLINNVIRLIEINNFFTIENIPLFFINKLEECNTIMGQQQLDCILFMHQCNFYKNRPDKLENYEKKIKQKVDSWLLNNNICFKRNNENLVKYNL